MLTCVVYKEIQMKQRKKKTVNVLTRAFQRPEEGRKKLLMKNKSSSLKTGR